MAYLPNVFVFPQIFDSMGIRTVGLRSGRMSRFRLELGQSPNRSCIIEYNC
jgi:hypothetical protein